MVYLNRPVQDGDVHLSAPFIYADALEELRPKPGMSFLNIVSNRCPRPPAPPPALPLLSHTLPASLFLNPLFFPLAWLCSFSPPASFPSFVPLFLLGVRPKYIVGRSLTPRQHDTTHAAAPHSSALFSYSFLSLGHE